MQFGSDCSAHSCGYDLRGLEYMGVDDVVCSTMLLWSVLHSKKKKIKKKTAWSPMLPYKYLIEHMKTINDYLSPDTNSTLCVIAVLCSNNP